MRQQQRSISDLPLVGASFGAARARSLLGSLLLFPALALIGCGPGGGDSVESTQPGAGLEGSKLTLVAWMNDIAPAIANRKLNEIVLPGTHDSGTYGVTSTSAPANDGNPEPCTLGIVAKVMEFARTLANGVKLSPPTCMEVQRDWSKSQAQTTLQQLAGGIRYIDLRVESSGDRFQVVHSLVSTDMDNVLRDVKAFYAAQGYQSREIVLLDINHTYRMTAESDSKLVEKIKSALTTDTGKSLLIPRCADQACTQPTDLTLSKLWATPEQRVIVLYRYSGADDSLMRNNRELWYSTWDQENPKSAKSAQTQIISNWPQTNSFTKLTEALRKYAWDADTAKLQASGGFSVLQAIRTFDATDIKNAVTSRLWDDYGYLKCVDGTITILGITFGKDFCVSNEFIWEDASWCTECPTTLLAYGDRTNDFHNAAGGMDGFLPRKGGSWSDQIFSRAANILIVDDYASGSLKWDFAGGSHSYVQAVRQMNLARYCDQWHVASPPDASHSRSIRGAGLATADIDGNGQPELVAIEFADNDASGFFQGDTASYRIGWNVNRHGYPGSWSDPIAIDGSWPDRPSAGGVAIGDIDGNGNPDVVVFYVRASDGHASYRIGWNLSSTGVAVKWSAPIPIGAASYGTSTSGGGIAIADIDGNGRPELVTFHLRGSGYPTTSGYYRIGWNLDSATGAATQWGDQILIGDKFATGTGGGIAIADIDGNGRPELVTFHMAEPNYFINTGYASYYRVGWDLSASGSVARWDNPTKMEEWTGNARFGGIALADVNGNGRPDLFAYGAASDPDAGSAYYRFGLDLTAAGSVPDPSCAP